MATDGVVMATALHARDESCLEPYSYLSQIPGKDVRGALMDCFQLWLQIPEDKLAAIKEIITSLHNASLLVDDIEDNSKMRRGVPVAHSIYGIPSTINCANYVYFLALEKCHQLGCPTTIGIFIEELLNLHRGQGQDILWREQCTCPTGLFHNMINTITQMSFFYSCHQRRNTRRWCRTRLEDCFGLLLG
jgi:geranylgeranyl diphosphate synthase type 3